MKERLSAVRWKKVSIGIIVGLVLSLPASTIYTKSRMKDDLWCVQIFPDGSEKTFYGAECNFSYTVIRGLGGHME